MGGAIELIRQMRYTSNTIFSDINVVSTSRLEENREKSYVLVAVIFVDNVKKNDNLNHCPIVPSKAERCSELSRATHMTLPIAVTNRTA